MADEVTDASNDEQLVLCLRSVDGDLVSHEDLIGLFKVPNIWADTLVSCKAAEILSQKGCHVR